jgi:hypothetical protein
MRFAMFLLKENPGGIDGKDRSFFVQPGKQEKEKTMLNYIYGSATTLTLITMLEIVDQNVPNDLAYYIEMILPF